MQRAAISWQIRVSIWCFAAGLVLILWTVARVAVQQSATTSAPAPQQIAIVPTVEPTDTPQPTATPEPTLEPPTAIPEPTATEQPTATPEPTATELPTTTPELGYVPVDRENCPTHALIKGNIVDRGDNAGERIYHTPESRSYSATHPERCFMDAHEAELAGFRAANMVSSSVDGFITRDMLGESWPLTVDEITLHCIDHAIIGGVNGVMYAINGTAKSRAEAHGWRDIDEIWADDVVGLKKDLSVLITMGEQRCVKE